MTALYLAAAATTWPDAFVIGLFILGVAFYEIAKVLKGKGDE